MSASLFNVCRSHAAGRVGVGYNTLYRRQVWNKGYLGSLQEGETPQ